MTGFGMRGIPAKTRITGIAFGFLLGGTFWVFSAVAGPAPMEAGGRGRKPDPRTIRLNAVQFDPLSAIPDAAPLPRLGRYPKGARGGYLVQFDHPIRLADRLAVERAGASVKGYVPMMTLEVVMTEGSRSAVQEITGVRWVGVHQPGFKIRLGLLKKFGPPLAASHRIRLQVNLFPGEQEPATSQIRGLGARILRVDHGRSYELVEVEIPAGRLEALTRVPQVQYIEEVYERAETNDRSRFHTGLSDVADDTFTSGLDPSLDGLDEGFGFQVKYGHFDTGLEIAHPDFNTATVTFEPGADSSDTDNGHGTHTAGSLIGDSGLWSTVPETPPQSGSVSQERWRGVQPQAALHHISFDNNFTDRQIFERESEVGAHISTNSWSYVECLNPPVCSDIAPLTDYNSNAAVWDEGVWDADDDQAGQQPLIAFFAAGNNGGFNSPFNGCLSNGGDLVGNPGVAKNVITVANNETDRGAGNACGSFSTLGDTVEEVNASSARGPVDPDGTGQGLFKPDVTNIGGYWVLSTEATGTASQCDAQFVLPDCPTDCSDTGPDYAYANGTSMSTPLTAGLAGVLLQDLVVNRGVTSPKPSLIKALLINGARDLQPGACDYTYEVDQSEIHEGWGFVQAKASLYGPGGTPGLRNIDFENEVSDNAVATGGQYQRQIVVDPGSPLKVTLVWTDFPATPGSGSPLVVNDLDLEISGPDGTFLGNNFGGNWSVTGGTLDRYNVVENVFLQNPVGGTYTLTVRGFQVSQDQEPGKGGINQDFSLVWSGNLGTSVCGDGACGGSEDSCSCPEDCGPPPTSETDCTNGLDDDCDGFADCEDLLNCFNDPACLPFCGDGTCDPGEDCNSCGADCISGGGPVCGNGVCEVADGEDCQGCPADCNGIGGGRPSERFCCGLDVSCPDSRCSTGGFTCTEDPAVPFCCGDGVCEGGEDLINCDVDCSLPSGMVPDGKDLPGSSLTVTFTPGGDVTLTWDVSCLATDVDFEIYEGTIGDFSSHIPRFCSTGGATTITFGPALGSTYYLVVPRNSTREGSYGRRSDGSERPQGIPACLLQKLGSCP